jgi:hypothetical protein
MDNNAAAINNNVIGLLNCDKKRMMDDDFERALKLFKPYCLSLAAAASPDKPFSVQERDRKTSSFLRLQKFSIEDWSILHGNYFISFQLTAFAKKYAAEAATIPVNAILIVPFIIGCPVTLLLKYPNMIKASIVTIHETVKPILLLLIKM